MQTTNEITPIQKKFTIIFGLCFTSFLLILAVWALLSQTKNQFVCYRSQNICYTQEASLFSKNYTITSKMPLSDIRSVSIESYFSNKSEHYRTILHTTKNDSFFLFNQAGNSDFKTHTKYVEQINSFLVSSQSTLIVQQSLFMVILFFLIIIFILLVAISRLIQNLKNINNDIKGISTLQKQQKEIQETNNFNKFFSHTSPSNSFNKSADSNKEAINDILEDTTPISAQKLEQSKISADSSQLSNVGIERF